MRYLSARLPYRRTQRRCQVSMAHRRGFRTVSLPHTKLCQQTVGDRRVTLLVVIYVESPFVIAANAEQLRPKIHRCPREMSEFPIPKAALERQSDYEAHVRICSPQRESIPVSPPGTFPKFWHSFHRSVAALLCQTLDRLPSPSRFAVPFNVVFVLDMEVADPVVRLHLNQRLGLLFVFAYG